MRIVNVELDAKPRLGFQVHDSIYIFGESWSKRVGLPLTVEELFTRGENVLQYIKEWSQEVSQGVQEHQGQVISAAQAIYHAPVPSGRKIICVGLNYKKHAAEADLELPKVPLLFSKFDNTLTGHNRVVMKPAFTEKLDYEAEVCAVIGRKASHVSREDAANYVLGYTNANDLSARDAQFVTSQWLLGKSCDDFCPLGPAIATFDEVENPENLRIRCFVNGEIRQDSNTSLMIFSFPELVHYISRHFTLNPGDIILSGTPEGVILGKPEKEQNWLQPGDEVVVEVSELGRLKSTIG